MNDATTPQSGREQVLRLLTKYVPQLTVTAFSVIEDWELAEEAVQDAAVFICDRWADYTPGTNFLAWARTIVRHRAHKVIRKKVKHRAAPLEVFQEPVADEPAEARFDTEWTAALHQCLDQLPEKYREMTDLRYREQKSCEEVAGMIQKSVDAVYMSLSRIRNRLRDCISRRLAGEIQ
jgi:RNA polymerase sigma-70 factor (ECF subfamily)